MIIPPWALFAIAAWLLGFGAFRIVTGMRERRRDDGGGRTRGFFGMSWRRHVVFGAFYVVVGAYVMAMAFGLGVPTPAAPDEPVPLPPERSNQLILE